MERFLSRIAPQETFYFTNCCIHFLMNKKLTAHVLLQNPSVRQD